MDADLVIVMGTSLKVMPFASLLEIVDEEIPIILINKECSFMESRENTLFLEGDIDDRIK